MYLQHEGAKGARGNQKLEMGPFGHGALSGDMEYPGGGGLAGLDRIEMRWWDYWLKGVDNGIMDEPPVKAYMMASARKGAVSPEEQLDVLRRLAAGACDGELLPPFRRDAVDEGPR